jgi:hypothetical protein
MMAGSGISSPDPEEKFFKFFQTFLPLLGIPSKKPENPSAK